MLTQKEITEGNEKIAEFLGWFQEEDNNYTWFEKGEFAIYVAYSLHPSGQYNDLPFYRDWNYLMKAVTKLEDMGFCIHSSNYCRNKGVKNNLAAHIGFNLTEDFYTDIGGSIKEDGTTRYFQVQRMDAESRLEATFKTIVMFLEYYQDKTVRIVNISDSKVKRVEKIN